MAPFGMHHNATHATIPRRITISDTLTTNLVDTSPPSFLLAVPEIPRSMSAASAAFFLGPRNRVSHFVTESIAHELLLAAHFRGDLHQTHPGVARYEVVSSNARFLPDAVSVSEEEEEAPAAVCASKAFLLVFPATTIGIVA